MSKSKSATKRGPGRIPKIGKAMPGRKLWKLARRESLGGVIGGR